MNIYFFMMITMLSSSLFISAMTYSGIKSKAGTEIKRIKQDNNKSANNGGVFKNKSAGLESAISDLAAQITAACSSLKGQKLNDTNQTSNRKGFESQMSQAKKS